MDKDMKEMVRHTLLPGDKDDCYEPKLTRAKIRYRFVEIWNVPIGMITICVANTNFSAYSFV